MDEEIVVPEVKKTIADEDFEKIEISDEIVSRSSLKMMQHITDMKYGVLKTVARDIGEHNPDNERIYAFVALASSTEDGIVKSTKLKLEQQKNQIDAQAAGNQAELARELLKQRNERLMAKAGRNRNRTEDKERSYQPDEDQSVTEGEIVSGEDHQTYKEFKKNL